MTQSTIRPPDPNLDLVFERVADVPPELVWRAWTVPEHLMKWFCPAPWKTVECEIDLRPGGIFRTIMVGPEGQRNLNMGCYLEIVDQRKLVWTNALGPGYRPIQPNTGGLDFAFTAVISIEPNGNGGTRYTGVVIHGNPESRKKHEDLGFQEGWGAAFNQLVALIRAM